MINIVNGMNAVDFLAAINANDTSLLTSWDCKANTFRTVDNALAGDAFAERLNANLRSELVYCGMTGSELLESLNASYAKQNVRRFQDYIDVNVVTGGEPTALISDDGNRLDLLGTGFYTYSTDGVTFAASCGVFIDDAVYANAWCNNYFHHNGKTYCTSTGLLAGNPVGIILWEEAAGTVWGNTTAPKYFDNPQIIYPYVVGGVNNFGNSFVFEDNGTWYLLIEASGEIPGWPYQIYLASCATFDGTYTRVQTGPVVTDINANAVGNPEIVMNGDVPHKCDGKYYMYYHHGVGYATPAIYRAYSYDLITWVIEGPIVDGRAAPARSLWTNEDQCVCEFKGKSYLFYTNNANQYLDNDPAPGVGEDMHIDMCIDFRPMSEILRLKP